MPTDTTQPGRLTRLILDLDYGDEQERLRYYELYAVAVHLQLIALPAVGAAVITVGGDSAIGPVLIMLATAFLPILFGLSHLSRHHVRAEAIAMSRRNRGYMIAYGVSYLSLVAAIALRYSVSGLEPGLTILAASGLVIGIAAAAAATEAQRRRRAEHTTGTDE